MTAVTIYGGQTQKKRKKREKEEEKKKRKRKEKERDPSSQARELRTPTQHLLKHYFNRRRYNVVDYAWCYWGVDWRI